LHTKEGAAAPDPAVVAPSELSTETALQCLFHLGAQRGRYVEFDAFKRQHGLARRIDLARLPSLAPGFGVELERRQLSSAFPPPER
jgi:hypothetical protein